MQDGEMIEYPTFDGTNVKAFLVGDKKSKSTIIVIQEIWGLTNYIKSYSKRLASQGHLVLAPHLYSRKEEFETFSQENIAMAMKLFFEIPPEKRGDKDSIGTALERATPEQRDVITRLMMGRGQTEDRMVKDLAMGYEYLKSNFTSQKYGVVGFCMGGGLSFRISTHLPFDATVVYYGANPPDLNDISKMKGPTMVLYAGDDPRINSGIPDAVEHFVKFKKQIELKIYPNTNHAFANNDGSVYNREAAEDAWERASSFFRKYLQ
ncbi:MAG: dienelactone hydrolase family protein [Thermoplasmatales archaeon]|jgi:carboxymethylenebutenolidase|nr:dienelactone hydrolase family protein [Candidatus Thermoplasmatota archaeon]MCL6002831.1 dienelactone hydrolase family protein [Candidatus Thermoplasmatota archaeon]MDA8054307.1 dienelactone hydrolase family protein [Thermoplasmatales archaeon]